MKQYKGLRASDRTCRVLVSEGDQVYDLPPRLDLVGHSPDGFEWGYPGSGPTQLALALLADHLGDDQAALKNYRSFASHVISILPEPGWELAAADVSEAFHQLNS